MPGVVAAIRRYPVKGLGPEPLDRVALAVGRALPDDRRWAMARGAANGGTPPPAWAPRAAFAQCHNTPALAALATRYEPASTLLKLRAGDGAAAQGRLDTAGDHAALTSFLLTYVGASAGGALRFIEATDPAGGHVAFTDTEVPLVSIIGLASLQALAQVVGRPVDAGRFRANLWVDSLPAWHEFDWEGRRLRIGDAELRVVAPITRCAAIDAGPAGTRDLPLLAALERHFGHVECGVYAEIVGAGEIGVGAPIVRL